MYQLWKTVNYNISLNFSEFGRRGSVVVTERDLQGKGPSSILGGGFLFL